MFESIRSRNVQSKQRGASALEFAFVIVLILFPLIFGIIDFSRALYAYHWVSYAAREGTSLGKCARQRTARLQIPYRADVRRIWAARMSRPTCRASRRPACTARRATAEVTTPVVSLRLHRT